MTEHTIIEPFTLLWYQATISCIGIIVLILISARCVKKSVRNYIRTFLGVLFLLSAILIHPYLIHLDRWALQTSLPLHWCTLIGLSMGFAMLFPNQSIYEFIVYWGVPGGFHSILTPEFIHGTENLLVVEYYLLHGGMILTALYLTIIDNMRVYNGSWKKLFLWSQLSLPLIGMVNWLTGSNYMYLSEKPLANNPFIIGNWPWYIVILEIVCLLHFFLIYLLFRRRVKESDPTFKSC
jgi:hypothetical integral membrane protein (TIGR02206 family)